MAKSKLNQLNNNIAKELTTGFKKMSEQVIGSYTKIEDCFVDQYLTKDGESIAAAKVRLKQESTNHRNSRKKK